jgi:hypothetical protein
MAKTAPPKPPRPKSDHTGEAPIAALEFRFDCLRYGHWGPHAERARLAAYVLWRVAGDRTGRLTALWHDARYSYGDAGIAMLDGFRRESAVAIELIIKAVIAEQLKLRRASERVPHTHNIPKLWQAAGLRQLNREDEHLLISFQSILMWSGRYATPLTVQNWAKEYRAFAELERHPSLGPARFIGWDEFDRLFQMARSRLLELRTEAEG